MYMSQLHCQQYLQAQRYLNVSIQLLNEIKDVNCLSLGVDVAGGMYAFFIDLLR
jgi:hypothetical protein